MVIKRIQGVHTSFGHSIGFNRGHQGGIFKGNLDGLARTNIGGQNFGHLKKEEHSRTTFSRIPSSNKILRVNPFYFWTKFFLWFNTL